MSTATDSRSYCAVGCKLPNGIILEMGKRGERSHQSVKLNGANTARVVGGYGITEGVSTEFMQAYMKKHARMSFVQKGLVFIHGDVASAEAHAREQAEVKNGFERTDPLNPMPGNKKLEPDLDNLKKQMKVK